MPTLSKRTVLYHFHKIIELAEIEDREARDLVPYSLRHFMITQQNAIASWPHADWSVSGDWRQYYLRL